MNPSLPPRKFWTPARLALSIVTFALLASVGVSSCSGPTAVVNNSNDSTSKPIAGQPPGASNPGTNPAPGSAPLPATVLNTELKALDGSTFKLADYKGKIVVVNLWATWCGPCRSETPDLIKASEEFKGKGVEIIGLTNEDPEVDADKVRAFVKEFNVTYRIGWSDQSFALALMQGNVRNSIPQSFVISRDGRVLKRFIGYNPIETPRKLRQALDEAVNSPG